MDSKPTLKHLLIIGFILISFFFASELFWEGFDSLIVHTILSKKFTDGEVIIQSILLIAVSLSIGLYFSSHQFRNRFKASILTIFVLLFVLAIYLYERFGDRYEFTALFPNSGNNAVYQSDVLFALVSWISAILILNHCISDHRSVNNTFLVQDIPINSIDEDEYNRGPFIKKLITELNKINFGTSRSFTIGINSPWGSGKTSVLNITRNELLSNDCIFIDYNPWLSSHKDNLTYDFFVLLDNKLSDFIETNDLLKKYGKKLSKIDSEKNPLKSISELFEADKSIKEQFDFIASRIKNINKRIFIIVDDLDRLNNIEILQVLQLIRNTANFPNLIFITAYDKRYLTNALSENKIFSPEEYIKKIFELEIVLPQIESLQVLDTFFNILFAALGKIEIKPEEKQDIIDQLSTYIFNMGNFQSTKISVTHTNLAQILSNKRDAIKLSNSFLLTYVLNKDNVYVPDLLILELIKYYSTSAYNLLAQNDHYLDIQTDADLNVKTYSLYNNQQTNSQFHENIFRVNLYNIREHDVFKDLKLKGLLSALFSKSEKLDFQFNKSIFIVDNFQSYFLFGTSRNQVSMQIVNDLISE